MRKATCVAARRFDLPRQRYACKDGRLLREPGHPQNLDEDFDHSRVHRVEDRAHITQALDAAERIRGGLRLGQAPIGRRTLTTGNDRVAARLCEAASRDCNDRQPRYADAGPVELRASRTVGFKCLRQP